MATGKVLATAFSIAALMAAAPVAHAQTVDFACPKAGTIEQRANATIKYGGASSSDPYLCRRIAANGKTEHRLFNIYGASSSDGPDTNAAARAGMMDLLAGRKTTVSFPYTPADGYTITDTWKVLRKEPLSIGGQIFNTIVLDRDLLGNPNGRSGFHGHYVMWLDPKTGLWLKSDFNVIAGQVSKYPSAYTDVSITFQ